MNVGRIATAITSHSKLHTVTEARTLLCQWAGMSQPLLDKDIATAIDSVSREATVCRETETVSEGAEGLMETWQPPNTA